MDFWQHLNLTKDFDLQGITQGLANHLSALIMHGHSVADLLAHFADEFGHLPAERLRQLAQAHRRWQLWRKRQRQLDEARRKAKLEPLPAEVVAVAPLPDQLDAIVRTARLCPREGLADKQEWVKVLKAGVELWTRCLSITRKQGQVHCRARDLEQPAAAEYEPYLRCSEDLEQLAPHRWLAIRRGQREGALEVTTELPLEMLRAEVERAQPMLGPTAATRSVDALLQELVVDDLEPWLLKILDTEVQNRAIGSAAESLAGLLRSAPLQARQVGAVHLTKPGAMAAAVVIDREGDIVAQKSLRAEGSWLDKIVEFFAEQETAHVVLPTVIPASNLLATLEEQLSAKGLQVVKVRSAALAEARQPLTDPPHRLSASVASAVVLGRRAMDPLKEWSAIDPVSIGIAEYQNDLDQDLLRGALTDTVQLCLLERRRGKRVSMGGGVARGSAAMARLNPLVKTLADLKAGMSVYGLVTNISHFGAFVNIGLPQEALVHISELSDQFVANPNDVVSIGQQVTAHVLTVDAARGRISLSLKNQANRLAMERERRPERSERPSRLSAGGGQMSKAQALANLEKLFKK